MSRKHVADHVSAVSQIFSLVFVIGLGLISMIRHGAGDSLRLDNLFEGSSSNPGSYAIARESSYLESSPSGSTLKS